ncbi:hypothetical protein Sinme_6683 (plasmid) [Sinorhizobium meliloti AK83]|nr:hypothetical protein Sinme_6683 [Sinorhizobium meliloti AK83]SEJ81392.1 hypothetical protein SAMN04244575_06370 [Sinorhizobium meliloti]
MSGHATMLRLNLPSWGLAVAPVGVLIAYEARVAPSRPIAPPAHRPSRTFRRAGIFPVSTSMHFSQAQTLWIICLDIRVFTCPCLRHVGTIIGGIGRLHRGIQNPCASRPCSLGPEDGLFAVSERHMVFHASRWQVHHHHAGFRVALEERRILAEKVNRRKGSAPITIADRLRRPPEQIPFVHHDLR